jgi:hypothetical protein
LGVINLGGTEQCLQRVVSRNHESSKVDEEFAADVKEDKEEVETDQAEEGIDLGDAGLFLEVVEDRVLGELRKRPKISSTFINSAVGDGLTAQASIQALE